MMPSPHIHGQKKKVKVMLKLQLANWERAEHSARLIRQAVFIEEQGVPEEDEWGHGDEKALHLIVIQDDYAIATARLMPDATVGRMAVLKEYRNQGVGSAMLEKLVETAKKYKFTQLQLNAQRTAEGFYAKHGFVVEGDEFIDAGIPHIKMSLSVI